MSASLRLARVDAFYDGIPALQCVELEVLQGGVTALLGPNGAGKTTLLRAVSGLVEMRGEISFAGRRIDRLSTEAIAKLGIAHVPDGRGTFANMTVEENLRIGALLRRDRMVARDVGRVYSYFPRLRERARQLAGSLSGGEQQMLAIGRAIMSRPRLMMLDEPSLGLAPLVILELFQILRAIRDEEKVGVLLVEQNVASALQISDWAVLLENGRVAMAGSGSELQRSERVRQAYIGFSAALRMRT